MSSSLYFGTPQTNFQSQIRCLDISNNVCVNLSNSIGLKSDFYNATEFHNNITVDGNIITKDLFNNTCINLSNVATWPSIYNCPTLFYNDITVSGNIYNNNLQNAIRDIQLNLNGNASILGNNIIGSQANIQGSTINIGNITSSVYINGALYLNGDL